MSFTSSWGVAERDSRINLFYHIFCNFLCILYKIHGSSQFDLDAICKTPFDSVGIFVRAVSAAVIGLDFFNGITSAFIHKLWRGNLPQFICLGVYISIKI